MGSLAKEMSLAQSHQDVLVCSHMRLESYSVGHGCSQPLSSMVAGSLLSWFRMLCHLVSVFSKVLPCWAVSSAFPKDFVLLSWTATVPLLPFLQIFYVTWHFIFWLFTLKQLVKVSSYPGADYDHVPLYLLPQPLWWLLACLYRGEDHLKTSLAAYGFEGFCKASICRICCGVSQQAVFLVQRTPLCFLPVLSWGKPEVKSGEVAPSAAVGTGLLCESLGYDGDSSTTLLQDYHCTSLPVCTSGLE